MRCVRALYFVARTTGLGFAVASGMFNHTGTYIYLAALLTSASMACGGTQELDSGSVGATPQALALADVNIWTPTGFGNKTLISVCFMPAVTDADRQIIREGAEN